ncbi:hypothetical protein [Sinorhizobium psoraleae]|uniref:Uncharacterized protein n=1 Tax=Sinorhizobium psoraleae TaxID=520838 RepID=A0ABT4KKV3_9HYPH|nr:hypothetical protein [Sinorhizobium psoraleae]MCZ4092584.1 hypothetical protein [Sinorhizobium psoraleae]
MKHIYVGVITFVLLLSAHYVLQYFGLRLSKGRTALLWAFIGGFSAVLVRWLSA